MKPLQTPLSKLTFLVSTILVSVLLLNLVHAHMLTRYFPVEVKIEVPPGTRNYTLVQPNSTVFGYIILESRVNRLVTCHVELSATGCRILAGKEYTVKLRFKYDAKVIYVNLTVTSSKCVLNTHLTCNGQSITLHKVLVTSKQRVTVSLILPSDSLCHPESKFEKYTLVVRAGGIPLLNLLAGVGRSAHPNFLGFGCVRVSGRGFYTAVLIIRTPEGKPAPISVSSSPSTPTGASSGVIILTGFSRYVVFPLYSQINPRDLVGTYIVDLYLYAYGSEKPILHRRYRIRIVVLDQTALQLVLFSGLVAVPFFTIVTVKSLRKVDLKELLLCALTASLIFTTAIIPGYVLWGISAALGPFDWVVYGVAWSLLRMMYYAIIVMLTGRPGIFTLLMFIVWILSTLFFGRLSIVSLLWVATSSLLYEPLLYLAGVTRGRPTLGRLLAAFTVATPVDHYVDLMLYMTLYRLYYADWYVTMYVIGTSIYSIVGAILGARLSRDLRVIVHE